MIANQHHFCAKVLSQTLSSSLIRIIKELAVPQLKSHPLKQVTFWFALDVDFVVIANKIKISYQMYLHG
ncbi:hypothetical protein MPTA9241_3140 [Mycoplasmoides pneumoniae]